VVDLLGKLDKPILELLRSSPQPLTLAEIAQKLGEPEKKVYKALRHLFERGQIEPKGRRYAVAKE
jgi:DNA-binding IclR family transcriptional regulator